ncbi:hypothetical protein FYJ28_12745 [Arthrobacter sp. BL-252-APC-1A]|nr:hypothetical protein [Arthrobacter sp. BL-252-APC-1A]
MNTYPNRQLIQAPAHFGCEHGWAVTSRHRTSQGHVVYVECVRCPARRVELEEAGTLMPARPLSRVYPGPPLSPEPSPYPA